MYKNAFTCGIPNSDKFGNLYAAALGAVAAKAELGLESLAYITQKDNEKASAMVESGKVEVIMEQVSSKITIDAVVMTEKDSVTVRIRESHTGIVGLRKMERLFFRRSSWGKRRGNGRNI